MQLFNILTEGDGSIRSMMAQFVNAQKKDARRAQNKWLGMIQARLMDLGFNYKRRRMIVSQLVTIADQKQFDTLIAQYKLFGNYSKTFKHTEEIAEMVKEMEKKSKKVKKSPQIKQRKSLSLFCKYLILPQMIRIRKKENSNMT